MAPPVTPRPRPENRRRKALHPQAARVDSIGLYQGGTYKLVKREKTPSQQPEPPQQPKPVPVNAPQAPAPVQKKTPARENKGPCTNPKCGATHSPQWRTGPHGEVLCNACATHCARYPGMRDPAAIVARQQAAAAAKAAKAAAAAEAAAAAKAAKAAAAAGPIQPPARRDTSTNNMEEGRGAWEEGAAASGAGTSGFQAAATRDMQAPPSRLRNMTHAALAPRDSLASDGAHPALAQQPSGDEGLAAALLQLSKRPREEEEVVEQEGEAAGGSSKRRRMGAAPQKMEVAVVPAAAEAPAHVILNSKRTPKPTSRLVASKAQEDILAALAELQPTDADMGLGRQQMARGRSKRARMEREVQEEEEEWAMGQQEEQEWAMAQMEEEKWDMGQQEAPRSKRSRR